MEQVSYNLRLDLKDTGIVNTGFRLKQGDSGMKIAVSIFNRGVNVFDSSTTPKIVFRRPDGASVMANMTVGSSVYEYVFVGNELQQPGTELMDVKFTLPNDKRESTVSCSFVVVPDTITPNTHGSGIYDNDLAEIYAGIEADISIVQAAVTTCTNAATTATNAASTATTQAISASNSAAAAASSAASALSDMLAAAQSAQDAEDAAATVATDMGLVNTALALIRLLFDKVYLNTENGDRILTQNGDHLIMTY